MKKMIFVVPMVLLLCNSAWAADKQQVGKVLDEAKTFFKEAVKLQGGWTSTQKMIKKADVLLAKGDVDKASKVATAAREQAKLSLERVKVNNANWAPPPYIK